MEDATLLNIGMINWVLGLVFMMLSNTSGLIKKTDYKRTGWRKYKIGYSINEIKKVIGLVDDKELKDKLTRKITYRKFSIFLLISTPVLVAIASL